MNRQVGTAMESSVPHPHYPGQHAAEVLVSPPWIPGNIEMQPPPIIEVFVATKKSPIAINPRYIQWARPSVMPPDKIERTAICVDGMDNPILADISYEEFSKMILPYAVFNPIKT